MYDTKQLEKDISPTGIKYEGRYENDRNEVYRQLYTDIIREVYNVRDVIIGHHLVYQPHEELVDPQTGPYTHTFVQEIPSADALIFDHEVAKKIFGRRWSDILCKLALEPVATRDQMLSDYYYHPQRRDMLIAEAHDAQSAKG